MFFTLFLRSFILLLELECVVGASVPVVRVGSRAKGDQRCARGFAVLQYTRKHGPVRERTVCALQVRALTRQQRRKPASPTPMIQ